MPDVQCPGCGGRYHETTDKFDPDCVVRGDMFKLKEMFRKQGWDSFLENSGVTGGDISCPECGSSYCDPLKAPFARGVRIYKELAAVQEAPPPSLSSDVAEPPSSPPGPRELIVRPPEKRFKNRRLGKTNGSTVEPI